MGLIGKLLGVFQKSQPAGLDDPVFGKLRFEDAGFWECNVDFAPLQRQVEVLIESDDSGPSAAQRDWYQNIEANYLSALPLIIDAAYVQVQQWDETIARDALPDMLNLETISINACDRDKHQWELTYFCGCIEHWVNVTLCNWICENVLIDG